MCLLSVAFSFEQIDDLHARLGSARTLPEYVRVLKTLGVERYDSYLADGLSEYLGQGGYRVGSARGSTRLGLAGKSLQVFDDCFYPRWRSVSGAGCPSVRSMATT